MLGARGRERLLWGRTAVRRRTGGWLARNRAVLGPTLRWGSRLAGVVVGAVLIGDAHALGWRLGGLALLGLGLTAPVWTASHHGDPAALRFRIRHRRIAWRLGCALLYGSFAVQLAGGPKGEGLALFLAGLGVAAVEPLVWRAWPKPLRGAVRRAQVAERYQDAVQKALQPSARDLRLGRATPPDPGRLAAWSGPGASGRAAFDPDKGLAGRPKPMHIGVKRRAGEPAARLTCRSGRQSLRWLEAPGELRLQHPTGQYLLPVAGRPQPAPGQATTATVPGFLRRHPVAEIVYYEEARPGRAVWRPARVALLDAEGYRLLELGGWIGQWSGLAQLASAAGLGFARYRLPADDDQLGIPLASRLFPWRRAGKRLSRRLDRGWQQDLIDRSRAQLRERQQRAAGRRAKQPQSKQPQARAQRIGSAQAKKQQRRSQPPRKA